MPILSRLRLHNIISSKSSWRLKLVPRKHLVHTVTTMFLFRWIYFYAVKCGERLSFSLLNCTWSSCCSKDCSSSDTVLPEWAALRSAMNCSTSLQASLFPAPDSPVMITLWGRAGVPQKNTVLSYLLRAKLPFINQHDGNFDKNEQNKEKRKNNNFWFRQL